MISLSLCNTSEKAIHEIGLKRICIQRKVLQNQEHSMPTFIDQCQFLSACAPLKPSFKFFFNLFHLNNKLKFKATAHNAATMTQAARLLIVYHSLTDGTRQMAHAAAAGAREEAGIEVQLLTAAEASAQHLLDAKAYLFATPENLAAISGVMKDFFDRSYYGALDRIQGRAYASLICAGSDGHNAARQIDRICTGWRLKSVAEPLIVCTHAQTPEAILAPKIIDEADLLRCRELGQSLAAGLALGIF